MSSRGYVSRSFVSSPALAADAIQQALLERALAERQAEMDAQKQREAEASIRQRDEALDIDRQRIAAAERDRADAASARADATEFQQASTIAKTMLPGIVDANTASLLQRRGFGGLVKQGQPTQGADLGVDENGVNQYDVVPGIFETSGGYDWQAGRQQAEERAAQAAATAEATAQRQREHDETIAAFRSSQPQSEPLEAVMGNDGNPVLMPRSQAAGRRPASGREQGRPVVSSDANRIAELDTALNELNALEPEIKGTGTASRLGAALPNFVTEITGVGAESKAKQGVIDRVKQIIGKAFEGGVLRKEDEAKYARILPTIGDAPQVSAAKLQGLRQAIQQKKSTLIDALSDAGYETGRFGARGQQSSAPTGGVRIKSITPIP